VVSALDAVTELLKQCKEGVTSVQGHPEAIVNCVLKIMKGECACQDAEEAEGGQEDEEEEAEQDEMLFEYAGEVLPNLGRALTPATFAPYFTGLLPHLLKKTKKHCSVAERSFAVGAIADSMEPLQGVLQPFLPHLLPLFTEMLKDEEDDVRNNCVFGLGEMVLWAGESAVPHYTPILAILSKQLSKEDSPRVLDQIAGAISRFLIANLVMVPVEDLLPALLNQLPLKEDLDEYELVFRAFQTLFTAGHSLTLSCLPKILSSAVGFTESHSVDKTKTAPILSQLLKSLASTFPSELQTALGQLSEEHRALVAGIVQS